MGSPGPGAACRNILRPFQGRNKEGAARTGGGAALASGYYRSAFQAEEVCELENVAA